MSDTVIFEFAGRSIASVRKPTPGVETPICAIFGFEVRPAFQPITRSPFFSRLRRSAVWTR